MSLEELAQLYARVSRAVRPEEIFESLAGDAWADPARAIERLEQEYLRLTRLANPERLVGNPGAQATARRVLTLLYEHHQAALETLEISGSSETQAALRLVRESQPDAQPVSPSPSPPAGSGGVAEVSPQAVAVRFAVTTPRGVYQAEGVLAEGDLSTVYSGHTTSGSDVSARVAIKIACEVGDNDLLLDEARTLRLFETKGGPQLKHLPKLIDQFQTPDGRAGLILGRLDGFDLTLVRKRYPDGIDPQHAIWMLRRVLSVLGFAHSQGVVHGNIEPTHILISPADHNAMLIDWSYSIVDPSHSGRGFKAHNPDYSAPEVAERKPPLPASDLYSLGKCMIYVLGGDLRNDWLPPTVDERLARFIQFFVRSSPRQRAQDAWEMYEKLKAVRQEIYGPHQFVPFHM